uniref:Uncharacterized protein n=1 Tax=Panagrolaimus davidi TaxID=227884 RepID=A0A914PYK6_9BILA
MSSSSDSQNADNSSMVVIPPKRICFDGKFFHQDWSLPDSIIYYIAQNPSSAEFYLNLIETCKYFFAKHPILLCPGLGFDGKMYEDKSEALEGPTACNDLESPVKLWIVGGDFGVFPPKTSNLTNGVSSFIENIYRCEAESVYFVNQIISHDELLFLTSSVHSIHFDQVTVKNKDGSILPLEKIVEAIPKLKEIY